MSKKQEQSEQPIEQEEITTGTEVLTSAPKCFVIMPLADVSPYEPGHFDRVYSEIIQPACEIAGFKAETASESRESHKIVTHILRSIVSYEMAICDLSSSNANVFYELGIRQMAKMPVTIIKDDLTLDKFDVRGFRYQSYSRSLRSDLVKKEIQSISQALKETYANREQITAEFLSDLSVSVQIESREVAVSEGEAILSQKLDLLLARVGNLATSEAYSLSNQSRAAVESIFELGAGDFFKFAVRNGVIDDTPPEQNIFFVIRIDSQKDTVTALNYRAINPVAIVNATEKIGRGEIRLEKLDPTYLKIHYLPIYERIRKKALDYSPF